MADVSKITVNSTTYNMKDSVARDHISNHSNPHNVMKAQVGLGNVANIDQSKAIKSITRSGTTFTYTALDGSTGTFTQQDSNTTYETGTATSSGITKLYTGTGSATDGTMTQAAITSALNGKLSTSGNAASATKATQDSSGQQINSTYIKSLSISGRTITFTRGNNTTGTLTTQDTNTTYSVATASANGLMSSSDKSKLDGLKAASVSGTTLVL